MEEETSQHQFRFHRSPATPPNYCCYMPGCSQTQSTPIPPPMPHLLKQCLSRTDGGDMAGSHPPTSNKNRSNSTQRYAVKVAVHPTISPSSTKGRLTISPPWWDFPSLDITSSLADTSTNQTNQPSKQPASTTTTTTVPCTLTLAGCKVHG